MTKEANELLDRMIEAKKKLDNPVLHCPVVQYLEIYPNGWKSNPQLKLYCDRRVEAGIGVWAENIKNV